MEVAIGADLCTLEEAKDFLSEVPEKLPFMGTSCCPAWSVMAKREFPQHAECISMALTPMVLTGRLIKKEHPGCKVAFIGPCAAKKLEASRRSIRSDVDFVLTFEEVMGMFEAREVDFTALEEMKIPSSASADGRGFSVSGGVAQAVVNCIRELAPEREVHVEHAEGLDECRKMLMRGMDDYFFAPQSRYTGLDEAAVRANPELYVVADSVDPEEGGIYMVLACSSRQIFITGHSEYDKYDLDKEYKRDVAKGLNPDVPINYYKNDDPAQEPILSWRSTSNCTYTNWLNFVYQETPYDLTELKPVKCDSYVAVGNHFSERDTTLTFKKSEDLLDS